MKRSYHFYSYHSADLAAHAATPIPLRGTSPRESVSRNFQSPNGSLQISFACHPYSGGRIKPHSSDFPIRTTMHSAAKISPRGDAAEGGRRGAFPSGEARLLWFSRRCCHKLKLPEMPSTHSPTTEQGGKGTGFVGSPWATENPVTRFPPGQRWWRQPPKGGITGMVQEAYDSQSFRLPFC